jgi:hypothetical protein
MDPEALRHVLVSVLEERARVDGETHATHHRWIELQVEAQHRRQAIVDHVYKTIVGTVIVGALVWVGTQALRALKGA